MTAHQYYEQKSDEELVTLTLQYQEAYLYLMRRYENKLKRYIGRLSNLAREEIEDLVQEVFIKAYENLNDFDPSLKFSSWIYRITHNHLISHYRKLSSRPQIISYDEEENIFNRLVVAVNFDKNVDNRLLKDQLKQALNKLDLKYREVLFLKYFEDLDYQEIADVLKKPLGTIGTLINRGKRQLKEIIAKNGIKLK